MAAVTWYIPLKYTLMMNIRCVDLEKGSETKQKKGLFVFNPQLNKN